MQRASGECTMCVAVVEGDGGGDWGPCWHASIPLPGATGTYGIMSLARRERERCRDRESQGRCVCWVVMVGWGAGRDRLGPHQLLGQVLLDGRVGAACSAHSSRMKGWDGEGGLTTDVYVRCQRCANGGEGFADTHAERGLTPDGRCETSVFRPPYNTRGSDKGRTSIKPEEPSPPSANRWGGGGTTALD